MAIFLLLTFFPEFALFFPQQELPSQENTKPKKTCWLGAVIQLFEFKISPN